MLGQGTTANKRYGLVEDRATLPTRQDNGMMWCTTWKVRVLHLALVSDVVPSASPRGEIA